MRASRPSACRRFAGDERGAFMVLEAILVALLVLTAILFFTSLQRPTTGGDQGGLDLRQVSADTLQILQARQFNGQDLDGWVTNVTRGDAATAASVDQFLRQVLPTGARYSLRLDNGVSTLQVLPATAPDTPRGARGAEIMLLPNWANQRNATLTLGSVYPGQVLASGDVAHPLVTAGYACYQAPNGYSTKAGGTWAGHWKAAPAAGTSKVVAGQVPLDLPLGRWKVTQDPAVNDAQGVPRCSDASPPAAYVDVVRPECVGTSAPANCASPFIMYGLQLVVWFGA